MGFFHTSHLWEEEHSYPKHSSPVLSHFFLHSPHEMPSYTSNSSPAEPFPELPRHALFTCFVYFELEPRNRAWELARVTAKMIATDAAFIFNLLICITLVEMLSKPKTYETKSCERQFCRAQLYWSWWLLLHKTTLCRSRRAGCFTFIFPNVDLVPIMHPSPAVYSTTVVKFPSRWKAAAFSCVLFR